MFDIGFWELCLIAIAALLVVGPKRLPKIAYETGLWFGRLQRFLRKARTDIERELHQYEIKQTLDKHRREFENVRRLAEDSGKDVYDGLKSLDSDEKQKTPNSDSTNPGERPETAKDNTPERDTRE